LEYKCFAWTHAVEGLKFTTDIGDEATD